MHRDVISGHMCGEIPGFMRFIPVIAYHCISLWMIPRSIGQAGYLNDILMDWIGMIEMPSLFVNLRRSIELSVAQPR